MLAFLMHALYNVGFSVVPHIFKISNKEFDVIEIFVRLWEVGASALFKENTQ